jgi:hypothetical protein
MTQMMIKSPSFLASEGFPWEIFDDVLEGFDFTWPRIEFYPGTPGTGGFDLMYITGQLPSYEWEVFKRFTEVELTGINQIWVKCSVVDYVSGVENGLQFDSGDPLETWVDMWNQDELWLEKSKYNGILEHYETTLSIALDNGGGAPDLSTVESWPVSFKSYRADHSYIMGDEFTGTTSLNLELHVPNVNRTGAGNPWVDLYTAEGDFTKGTFNIYANNVRAFGVGIPSVYTVDAGTPDLFWGLDIDYRVSGVEIGIIARVQDTSNFWLLACKNPGDVDPVLGLYKVVDDVHTMVASYTATGLGPIDGFGKWTTFALFIEGNDIEGRMNVTEQDIATYGPMMLRHTDATFNTETKVGLWAAEESQNTYRRAALYELPLGFDATGPWASQSPFTSSIVDPGNYVYTNIYFYPGPNGPPVPPGDSTCGYWIDKDNIGGAQVFDHRCVFISTNTFLLKYEDVSGDTDHVSIQYGPEGTQAGVWFEPYNCNIAIEAEIGESWSATIDVTVAVKEFPGGGPAAGTEATTRVTIVASG